MSLFRITCPKCKRDLNIPRTTLGKLVKCPCGQKMQTKQTGIARSGGRQESKATQGPMIVHQYELVSMWGIHSISFKCPKCKLGMSCEYEESGLSHRCSECNVLFKLPSDAVNMLSRAIQESEAIKRAKAEAKEISKQQKKQDRLNASQQRAEAKRIQKSLEPQIPNLGAKLIISTIAFGFLFLLPALGIYISAAQLELAQLTRLDWLAIIFIALVFGAGVTMIIVKASIAALRDPAKTQQNLAAMGTFAGFILVLVLVIIMMAAGGPRKIEKTHIGITPKGPVIIYELEE